MTDDLLARQLAYYRARAGEYDQVYALRGFEHLTAVGDALPVAGEVLELACGTGQWTVRLARRADRLTALDGAPEMLAIARERVAREVPGAVVEFRQAELFSWRADRRYDVVFFAFWLSHVPPERFAAFWASVAGALRPGGRVLFVDTDAGERATERPGGGPRPTVLRRLDDGTEHEIVKMFYDPAALTADLAALGWAARVTPTPGGFISGVATLTAGR